MVTCFNSEELVELLLSKNADINAKKSDGTGVFTYCLMGIMQGKVSTGLAERPEIAHPAGFSKTNQFILFLYGKIG